MDSAAPYEVSISHYALGKLEPSLATGKIDVAIKFEFPHSSQIRSVLLSREALGIIARQDHPLAECDMDLDAYLSQYHVLVAPYERGANLVDMEFQRLGLERRIALRCQDYWTACKTVETTDFLLTATRSTLTRMLGSFPGNRLIKLPADLHTPEAMNICLYWHESAETDPDIRWLRDALRSIFEANSR